MSIEAVYNADVGDNAENLSVIVIRSILTKFGCNEKKSNIFWIKIFKPKK